MEQQKPTLNPCLRSFWDKPARFRVLYGGRDSTKSWDAAGRAIGLARLARLKFLCVRQFQSKIEESVYTLLKHQIRRFGFQKEFHIVKNKITHKRTGTEFVFYGIWNHVEDIRSFEGADVLWIEEGDKLSKAQMDVLGPTIRKQHSEIWIIFNPHLATDYVYKNYVINPPPRSVVRKINFDENPWLSQVSKDAIAYLKEKDYDDYMHIYEGVPKDDDESTIIKRKWIMASINAHNVLGFGISGSKRLGFDVADSGKDKCALLYAQGNVALWSDIWKAQEDELLKSCKRTYAEAYERDALIIYDSVGVGATAGAKFKEINVDSNRKVLYNKFSAGGGVLWPDSYYQDKTKNKDMFANIKAQAWWLLADRFKNTYNAVVNGEPYKEDGLVSLAIDLPYIDQIVDELSTPNKGYDKRFKVMVESKEDLLDRGIDSPNLAESFVMAYVPTPSPGFFGIKR